MSFESLFLFGLWVLLPKCIKSWCENWMICLIFNNYITFLFWSAQNPILAHLYPTNRPTLVQNWHKDYLYYTYFIKKRCEIELSWQFCKYIKNFISSDNLLNLILRINGCYIWKKRRWQTCKYYFIPYFKKKGLISFLNGVGRFFG